MKQYEAVIETTIRITDIVNAETEEDLEAKIISRRINNKYRASEIYVSRENTVVNMTEQVFRNEKDVLSDKELIEQAKRCADAECVGCLYRYKDDCGDALLRELICRFEKLRRDAE